MRNCGEYFTPQMSIIHFDTLTQCLADLGNTKLCNRLSQDLLPDMELTKNIFPTILYMKNGNRVQKTFFLTSTKDRMINFNISAAVKCRRDNKGFDEDA